MGGGEREGKREREEIDDQNGHSMTNLTYTVVGFIITSLLVLYFNIGVPNELRGCLFFVQVSMVTHPQLSIVYNKFLTDPLQCYHPLSLV